MGEVVAIAVIVVLAVAGFVVAARAVLGGNPRALSDPARALEPGTHRNHLAMARWIDARIHDDMVRPLLSEPDVERARSLLAEFYGESD